MSAEQLDDLPLAVEAYALALARRDVEVKHMALEIDAQRNRADNLTKENAKMRAEIERLTKVVGPRKGAGE